MGILSAEWGAKSVELDYDCACKMFVDTIRVDVCTLKLRHDNMMQKHAMMNYSR